ncbi:unnamed protein product [Lepeophtheirus salmonis]|uniref:(salmon louse) hypothetical protein n=1 Tax=Lepeophtheirus salmonis TaxID=72036 RepID=A0A817FCV4_LEPSM|nr:unnamed protein product [Lepeophtheirus salmonis]CAG9477047.1 unnamed protein product [Lepeophtheirus salmonis]
MPGMRKVYNCSICVTIDERKPCVFPFVADGKEGDCEPGCFENGKSNDVKQSCGSSKVGDLKKAKYGDHPWHVYVQEKNKDDLLCQGVLLTPIHVLTSAVCVVNRCFLKVSVGCVNIGDSNNNCQSRDVIRITPHFGYDNTTLANNLAITTASNSFKLNDGVIPVSIPFKVKLNRKPRPATLTGVKDNVLLSEVFNIVTKSPECTSQDTICTSGTRLPQGINVGSPLIGYDNGFCTLIGIRMKQIGNHTTYTKISHYLNWIKPNILYEFNRADFILSA